jgi:gliding motility-associated-like protein
MRIYNRWGELMFQSTSPGNCWDGHYKKQPQMPDVYVYLIRARTRCGNIVRKGTFALIR